MWEGRRFSVIQTESFGALGSINNNESNRTVATPSPQKKKKKKTPDICSLSNKHILNISQQSSQTNTSVTYQNKCKTYIFLSHLRGCDWLVSRSPSWILESGARETFLSCLIDWHVARNTNKPWNARWTSYCQHLFFSFFFGGKAGTGWRIITKTNLRMTRLKRDSCNCPSLSRKDKKGQNYTLGEKPCNLTVCYRACQRKAAANMPRFLPTALQNCECVYLHRTFFSCLQQRAEPEDPTTCWNGPERGF